MRNVTAKFKKDCKRFRVPTADDWGELAAYVAAHLKPGSIVAVSGALGAGKTTFVKALVAALGSRRSVVSPTFALLRSYKITKHGNLKRLLHLDAFRIEHGHELLALDLDEELGDGKTALVIEWPENVFFWLKKKDIIKISITT